MGAEPSAAGRVARNASLLSAATVVARVSMLALAVAMGRELGPDTYGRYGLALALAVVLVPFADAGLTPYLTREVARDRATGEHVLPMALRAKLLASAAMLGVVAAVSALLVDGELLAAIVIVSAAQLVDGVSAFVYGYFRGRERMGIEARITTASSFARSVGGIVLVLATGELVPVLAWLVLVSGLQLASALSRLRRAVDPEPARRRRIVIPWRTVFAMGSMAVFVMVYARADAVLVGLIMDETAVGWYTAAYTLLLGLQIVPWMVAVALGPVFARAHANDPELLRRSWHAGIRAVLVLALPLALAPSLLATPIVQRLFGAEFEPAGTALAILVWATPLSALGSVVAAILRAGGLERQLVVTSGVAAVANVVANALLIPRWGIDAAAAVTIATELGVLAAMTAVAIAAGIVPVPRVPYVRLALALGALALVALLLGSLPVEFAALAAFAAYAIVVAALGVVSRADVGLARGVVARR